MQNVDDRQSTAAQAPPSTGIFPREVHRDPFHVIEARVISLNTMQNVVVGQSPSMASEKPRSAGSLVGSVLHPDPL